MKTCNMCKHYRDNTGYNWYESLQCSLEVINMNCILNKQPQALDDPENDEYVEKVGIHWATEQIRDLLDHDVRGVQFFTLNCSTATQEIYKSLGVSNSRQLRA